MALTNFSLPFGTLTAPWSPAASPLHPVHQQLATSTNNLLYSPAEHQQQADGLLPALGSDLYKNNPYAAPQQQSNPTNQFHVNLNNRRKNTYLPPIAPPGAVNTKYHQQQQQQQQHQRNFFQHQQFSHTNLQEHSNTNKDNRHNLSYQAPTSSSSSSHSLSSFAGSRNTHHFADGSNVRQPDIHSDQQQYFSNYPGTATSYQPQHNHAVQTPASTYGAVTTAAATSTSTSSLNHNHKAEHATSAQKMNDKDENNHFPERPSGFTRVQAGQGSRTQVHAVLDYDLEEGEEEDYYDALDQVDPATSRGGGNNKSPVLPVTVTPIQGPIFVKNGTVPVVPLYSYPTINNGTLIQIPIWWTALSVALGLDISGDVIKGVPCIKRYNQLFCPTAGNTYPIEKIEHFIDENKALMRRMYGDFEMNMDNGGPRKQTKKRKRSFIDDPDLFIPPGSFPSTILDENPAEIHAEEAGETYFGKLRNKRQANKAGNRNAKQSNPSGTRASNSPSTGRLDACESKIEIVTPYWASNSAGKIRAIVNTQHFEQAIHQEICSKAQTPRCQGECGCEQKYKWHRLLAYDPDNDCKGIFMDWFLFPSCCVCRCNP